MRTQEFSWTPTQGWSGADPSMPDCQLVVFFASRPVMAAEGTMVALREKFASAIIVGSSGGGQIHNAGIEDSGITGIAMSFRNTHVHMVTASVMDSSMSFQVGRSMAHSLMTQPRADELKGVLLFTDGIHVNGDELITGLSHVLPSDVVIGGGMAADDDRFEKTLVAANAPAASQLAVGVGFYGPDIRVTSAHGSGWRDTGAAFQITASRMNNLYDLDGCTALDVYKRHLGDKAAQLPMSGLGFPLRVCNPADQNVRMVRTLLGVDNDAGMLTFAGNVPEGWMAQLMHAEPLDLISAASDAAFGRALDALATAQATILVSCIGRRLVLGNRCSEEVKAVGEALGGKPAIAGFYSYGEFGMSDSDSKPRLFNQTLTAFSLSEDEAKAA
jgi:hypothetical protein